MFSKLVDCRSDKRVKDGSTYYVCTFAQTRGDKNAKTFIEKEVNGVKMRVLNPNVAAIRNVELTKCLFPTEDANAAEYAQYLEAFCKCCESTEGHYLNAEGHKVTKEDCVIYLPLLYVTRPVREVFPEHSQVFYIGKDGKENSLTEFNAVGYSKLDADFNDLDVWDEIANGASEFEYIKRNALNNLNNGTYYWESIGNVVENDDELDEKPTETTKPKSPF